MRFEVNGKQVFASTGGREQIEGADWIIFLHGAGQSHLTWTQQARAFSYDGYNVLALDLPAHGDSDGPALEGADLMADWVIDVMDAVGIKTAHLVNHSMGGLISLEVASHYPGRIKSVVFIATAMTIAVNEVMIGWARTNPHRAFDMMTSLGHGMFGHMHGTPVPGVSLISAGLRIMGINQPDALPADLVTCANYQDGLEAAGKITCPVLVLLSGDDRMIAPRFGAKLHEAINNSTLVTFEDAGHMLPAEQPREINAEVRKFYQNNF